MICLLQVATPETRRRRLVSVTALENNIDLVTIGYKCTVGRNGGCRFSEKVTHLCPGPRG